MMKTYHFVEDLPSIPAVYVMYGGSERKYIAYVGTGSDLKRRIDQHLNKRDSSVSTGTSASCLNPDYVTELKWWEHEEFEEKYKREAAEIVAFEKFNPSLRSRGNPSNREKQLAKDEVFKDRIVDLLDSDPAGKLILPNIEYLYKKILDLQDRVEKLENNCATH